MVKLLDFYADWCGPCKQQDPILDELKDAYADDDFAVEKVDVDSDQDAANEYSVRSLPTLILLDEDDNVVDRFVGVTSEDDLKNAIDGAL